MIQADSINYMRDLPDNSVDFVLADPPYDNTDLINEAVDEAVRISRGASAFFMYPETLFYLETPPDQVCHWVKPISTKNTKRRYSRFVEALAFFGLERSPFNQDTFWSTRSGIFTDSLVTQGGHPFKKPESLIEKILAVHTMPGDHVLDPFAGSGTVETVCDRMGRLCTSVEIESVSR